MVRTIDGIPRPIGDDPPKPKRGWIAGAVTMGVLLGGGTIELDVTATTARTGQAARPADQAKPNPRQRVGTTADAVRSAQRAVRVVNRLRRLGHQVQVRATADDGDCAAHSYGQVQAYLRAHPCVSLHRALLEVSSKDAGTVLIAIAWVRMPDQPTAAELKALLDRYGTGNVTELSRESGRYRRIRFTGRAYASWLDGDTVANAQAEPVAPGALGRKLTEIATNSVR